MKEILVLVHSVGGNTLKLAREVGRGVETVDGASTRLRGVPPITSALEPERAEWPDDGPALAENKDLAECAGLILGSPTRFGNMASAVKYFLDGTASEWFSGTLAGKPAGVFTSTSSLHGGQESTLLSMMIPLLHHGMVLCGVPYSEKALNETTTGGTPYGPSHWAGTGQPKGLSDSEKTICQSLGQRLATLAIKLQ